MAAPRLSDEHAHETAAAASPVSGQRLKRRGLIAGAAALVAGVLAKQAASPVSAWDSTHTFQSATGAATSLSPDVYADGIQGYADGALNAGVFGRNNALNGIGISGIAPSGIGVSGTSTSGPGVSGVSTSSHGVYGTTGTSPFGGVTGVGVNGAYGGLFQGPVTAVTNSGTGYALNAGSTVNHSIVGTSYLAGTGGVLGQTNASGTYGIIGNGLVSGSYAAGFNGTVAVSGAFTVYGTKSAAVPHPDGSYRLLYCLESPESWFEDFGHGQLSGGKATVTLDADFAATVVTDTLYVFVTPEGDTNGLYVTNKTATGFTVQELKGGTSSIGFTYRVVARRKDITGTRLAKTAAPPTFAAVQSPEPIPLPGGGTPVVLPTVDTKATLATPAPAPAGVRSAAPTPTNTPAPTTSSTQAATAASTATPTTSGTPAVIATPRATGSATNPPATSPPTGSVAPAPPRR